MDDETKLTLHGLQQYYCKLKDSEKNRKLFDLLDVLEFNQVGLQSFSIFVKWLDIKKMFLQPISLTNDKLPFFWFLSGGDLCEVCASLCGSVPAAGGAELPCYCHPQGHGTGREVLADYFLKIA